MRRRAATDDPRCGVGPGPTCRASTRSGNAGTRTLPGKAEPIRSRCCRLGASGAGTSHVTYICRSSRGPDRRQRRGQNGRSRMRVTQPNHRVASIDHGRLPSYTHLPTSPREPGTMSDPRVSSIPIDLLLVCGARPALLEQTLRSFGEKVFPHFVIRNVFANIDPFQGGHQEVELAERLVRELVPVPASAITIRKPGKPSLAGAVKWLWQSVKSRYAFHLEDDWRANEHITEDMVFPHFVENTRQVSILTREKNWTPSYPFHVQWRRRRFLGISFGRKLLPRAGGATGGGGPIFTTSPCFVERLFANKCAQYLDVSLDPEKQLNSGGNVPLQSFTVRYRNRFIGQKGRCFLITDLGRDYSKAIGIHKAIRDGMSIWLPAKPRV